MNRDTYFIEYSWETPLESSTENNRLSQLINRMLELKIVKTNKEFAEKIGENSVGLNDLKKGRKKVSIKHIKSMNKSYPFINEDFILYNKGFIFLEDYISKTVDNKRAVIRYSENIEKIKSLLNKQKTTDNEISQSLTKEGNVDLYTKLIDTQNKLIESKNDIIKLKDEIQRLKSMIK